jgi:hypothetical protein
MRSLAARTHLTLARLARRAEDGDAVARHRGAAVELLEAMGMRYWLERLDRDRVGPAGGV